MVTSLKMSHSHTATLSAYDPEAGHHRPMPPLEIFDTHAHVWVSFLCVSLLFSPGSWCAQVCCCAFQEPISAVLCKFCWFYDGVNGNLLQEGLLPYPELMQWVTADLYLHRRHSDTVLAQSLCVGHVFETFTCLRSSGDQVLGQCTVPGGPCILNTSLVLATQFPCVSREHRLRFAMRQNSQVSSGELISGCDPPG